MKLREALKLKNEFGFEKKTVNTEMSGADQTFHYFDLHMNGFDLMIDQDGDEWFGTIFDYPVRFYTYASFKGLIKSIQKGEWYE